ncbi:TraB/GumN family protein [Glaciimonas soli]|uniref:TraB/GumN family protein n=1 Tax=Glaciimonas soli TaxID=2590999 RepID=A0A843YSS6_9BURK|nr:TraB/GumN family protein [Glaciimonas soli]MQR00558.1 TraB/GumN family protein [Glaciimonas soli]
MLSQIIVSLSNSFHLLKRLWLPSLCAALLAMMPLAIRAQENVDQPSATATAPEKQGGALFKISRGEGSSAHVTYLFGTIHVGKADFFPLAPEVMQALSESSKVAVEIDPTDARMMDLVQKYALYPSSQALTDDISPSLYRNITTLLEKYHVPFDAAAPIWRMKPWLLATQLGLYDYQTNGFTEEDGVDNYLIAFAKAQHKPIVSLERIVDQLSLLGDMSIPDQVKFLQDSVDILQDTSRANMSLELTTLWRQGDLDGLQKLLQEMTNDGTFSGAFVQKALLDGRNPVLADGIEKMLAANVTSFAGIGTLHLVGANSVQMLLQQRGYTVQRVY